MTTEIQKALTDFYAKVLEPQFESIRRKQAEHDEKFDRVFSLFDAVFQRLDRLETEYHAIVQALRRIEERLMTETEKRELLERSVREIKKQMAVVRKRLVAVEHKLKRASGRK